MNKEQRERLREAAEALCLKYTGSPEWCIGMDLLALLDALNNAFNRDDGSSDKIGREIGKTLLAVNGACISLVSDCDGAEFERGRGC